MWHGLFSRQSLARQPKWLSAKPPNLRYPLHSSCNNNPFKELTETDECALKTIRLNEFNTVITASKTAIDFIASTTDKTTNDERTTNFSTKNLPLLAPPILAPGKISTRPVQLFKLSKISQRKSPPNNVLKQISYNGSYLRQRDNTGADSHSKFIPQQKIQVSLLSETRKSQNNSTKMVQSPSAFSTRKSKTTRDTKVTLTPEIAPVVVRSYFRDKLIATILDWYKTNPHPDNPKSTAIRKLLKKDLISEVFKIQDIMRANTVNDSDASVGAHNDEASAHVVTQTQPTQLELEDILRLIDEKYYELNGKRTLLTYLHGKTKKELLVILNTMEPGLDDHESDEEESDHYEEDDDNENMSEFDEAEFDEA